MRKAALFVASLCFVTVAPADAQGTRADYERAENVGERFVGKVLNAEIRPRWISGGKALWYQADGADGKRLFWRVAAATGKKEPAFDHARLAKILADALKTPTEAEKLPLDALTFSADSKAIYFLAGGKFWRCGLTDYVLTEIDPNSRGAADELRLDSKYLRGELRSGEAGGSTGIIFVNQSGKDLTLFWVDGEGVRHDYGVIKDGETRRQRTYANHAWLAVTKEGTPWADFVAEDSPKIAFLSTMPSLPEEKTLPVDQSPDGKYLIFKDKPNLNLHDLALGAEKLLTTDGKADNYYDGPIFWSPDSKRVVGFRNTPAQEHKVTVVESSPAEQVQPKLLLYDYLKPGDRIAQSWPVLFDAASGKEIPISHDLCPNPWEMSETRWSPDSSAFTFLYNQRGHQVVRLVSVDAATGKARTIAEEVSKTFVDYPNKIYHRFLDATGELIWMSERDGWNHLYLMDVKTGKVKNQITRGEWALRGVERVDEKARQVWFRAGGVVPGQDPYYVHYCRVNFDGSGFVDLTPGDGTHKADFSPDGKYLADTYSRVDMPPVLELHRVSDGKLIAEVQRADASALRATGWTTPEPFVAKGRDGKTDIYGVILRPSNFDPKRKYPVVEQIYAGPHDQHVPKAYSFYQYGQEVAELGFIIVRIDGMGTNWRSKAFHDVCWKNLADAGFPDRILWIKSAAAKYPQMDLSRGVGIYGGSAGGQNAMRALLDYPDFYTVAVADCGCHDNRMDKIWWNELWMGWPVDDSYIKSSNVADAKKLQGKLLLIVGELDTNVDPASTMQVVNALIKADKDFEMLVVPGAGHGAAGTLYGRRRQRDFLVRNLMGVEPRKN